jgi:DNA-binding response OmpR family regulator
MTDASSNRLLVADDDAELLALIGFTLRHAGFDVDTAVDGVRALEKLERGPFGLTVLDINMPGIDGFGVCERLRASSTIPVIMLSARNHETDIVRALELGADDYITKPFSPRTLVARIRALLRRTAQADAPTIEGGGATLDVERHALHCGGAVLPLTPLETGVLQVLLRNTGRLVTSARLAAEAWGRAGTEERHALKQVVYRLRRKLEDCGPLANALQTTRSAGYRWVGDRPAAEAPAAGSWGTPASDAPSGRKLPPR